MRTGPPLAAVLGLATLLTASCEALPLGGRPSFNASSGSASPLETIVWILLHIAGAMGNAAGH